MLSKCLAFVALAAGTTLGDVVELAASRDNTMYENQAGAFSNGEGPGFFAGKTAVGLKRRALIRFDLGTIPAGSTITDIKLTLNLSMTISTGVTVSLHRALRDWGEGASNAGDPGGGGVLAEPGDATWLHTFWDTQFWAGPGGSPGSDYIAAASAATSVGIDFGPYNWSATPALLADAQGWLAQPATNFGWFIIGDESTAGTAKRFDSRENPIVENRPKLRITYTPPTPPSCYANCDASTTQPCLNVLDFGCFLNAFAAGSVYANCDGSTTQPTLNVLDFGCFLNRFAAGCSGC